MSEEMNTNPQDPTTPATAPETPVEGATPAMEVPAENAGEQAVETPAEGTTPEAAA